MPRILIVDDEDEICEFLQSLFAENGYETAAAQTGEDAMALSSREEFDLALVDLKLSTAVTGLDVIRFIRDKQPKMKIIVMTGYIDAGLKFEAEQCGITQFAEKPTAVKPDILLPMVKNALAPSGEKG